LPGAIGQALLPEVAYRPAERRHLLWRAALMTGSIVVPILVIAYLVAPLGLVAFGPQYVAGATGVLRWLIIGVLIAVMNYVTGTILYLAKKTLVIGAINIINAAVVIGLAVTWAHNAQTTAMAWAIGDAGNAILVGLFALLAVLEVGGRFEDLGGRTAQQILDAGATAALASSQHQALDVLLELAQLQARGAAYKGSAFTAPMRAVPAFPRDQLAPQPPRGPARGGTDPAQRPPRNVDWRRPQPGAPIRSDHHPGAERGRTGRPNEPDPRR
jgi:hypothetical protein